MPAFAADSFGPTYIGKVYGFVLTAWGAAGVIGGLVFAKFTVQPPFDSRHSALPGFVIAMVFKRPQHVSHYK
jgi:OFA family oxalate/formate antiporter-like MFS transporter